MTKTSRYAILTYALGLITTGLLVAQATPEAPRPKAVLLEPVWSAGRVAKGDRVRHDFELRNEGQATLEVVEVTPACGCTVATFDKAIAPGAVGKIRAELDTTGFAGPIAKAIGVLTNDPKEPRLQLTLQAEVTPHVLARPGYARFIFVQGMKGGTISQTIWADDLDDFVVTGVVSPYPWIAVSFREATAEERRADAKGKQWRVDTTILSTAAVGAITQPVIVKTNHPKEPEVEVPLSGFVRPLMAATPPMADFGAEAITAQRDARLMFVNFDDAAIAITKVESTVPGIDADHKVVQEGHRFVITVHIKPGVAKGPVNGALRVFTTSDKQPVFEIPLRGTVL